jgi:hypothetical protein
LLRAAATKPADVVAVAERHRGARGVQRTVGCAGAGRRRCRVAAGDAGAALPRKREVPPVGGRGASEAGDAD